MKKLVLALLSLPLTVLPQNNFKKKASVLFIGNSYTAVNNLPLLVYNVVRANGDTMVYDSSSPGGYTFNNHFNNPATVSKIYAQNWDYVVLQAQSQEPSFPDQQVSLQTLPYALKLDSLIKDNYNCSKTVFYETWGRKNGDQQNCASFPPLCTYLGMQNRLRKWYKKFTDTTGAVMAPAGEAYRASIAANPALELYDPDQSHPSLAGSYLVACVFYETLFQRSVLSNTYNPGLAVGTLTFLQQVAHNVVRDSLPVWNMGKNLPWADFSYSSSQGNYQFSSASPSLANSWYFGDGGTSSLASPVHAYAVSGTYTVSHVVTLGCKKDSVMKVVNASVPSGTTVVTGISELNHESNVYVYPNPCKNALYIQDADRFKKENSVIEITDLSGRVISKTAFVNPVPVAQLANGAYLIKIANNLGSFNARFIKNE